MGQNGVKDDTVKMRSQNGYCTPRPNINRSAIKETKVVKASHPMSKPIFVCGANKYENRVKTSSSFFLKIPMNSESQTPTSTSRPPSTEPAFSEIELHDDDRVNWGECSFKKFAAAYFQTGATPIYSSGPIVHPLLKQRNQHDIDV